MPEVLSPSGGERPAQLGSKPTVSEAAQPMNYAALLKSSAQLQELGTPVEHISGAPFVLIPDENIEAAKLEFKDFIYARFHGDYPSMGKIIGVVNAVWAKSGPKIYVHNIGPGIYLLRVTNPRTRDVLLSRTCWNIGGLPMFVAPWSPDYSPKEPPLTSDIIPVELRNVPYLLFNQESLSRLATAVGVPDSLAPETERKQNFEVAKLFVRVDLTAPLPNKIISGFSNGREVETDVSYPWLPLKCDRCSKYGHSAIKCSVGGVEGVLASGRTRNHTTENARRRSKSRPGRSTEKKVKQGVLRYVPVGRKSEEEADGHVPAEGSIDPLSPTHKDHQLALEDLEEGEIYQQVIEVFNATQKAEVEAVVDVAELGLKVDEEEAAIIPTGSQQAVEEEAVNAGLRVSEPVDEPEVNDEIRESGPMEERTGTEVNSLETTSAPGLHPDAINNFEQGEDIDNYPPGDQESEKPFLLVNNRRSGRKAAKRH